MFRKLKASEIEIRVQSVTVKGAILLPYKDARCDMNILDESVGPYKWKREHSRDNANCTVSIWSDDLKQWISKEDTGTESFTEKEKGLASDSFKRACFNWGIGRELYTAPFIWVKAESIDIKKKQKNGKDHYSTYDKFYVSFIEYDDAGNIIKMQIKNQKTHKEVYRFSKTTAASDNNNKKADEKPIDKSEDKPNNNTDSNSETNDEKPLTDAQVRRLYAIASTKGKDKAHVKKAIMEHFKKTSVKSLTKDEYDRTVTWYEKHPDVGQEQQESES